MTEINSTAKALFSASQPVPDTEFLIQEPKARDVSNLVDIVAVHGLGGSPDSSWTSKPNPGNANQKGVNWLVDDNMLPHHIPTARILRFGYKQASFKDDIQAFSYALLRQLHVARDECPRRPIIWIGHSLGGLIIRKALVLADLVKVHNEFVKVTAGIALFGTPSSSMALSNINLNLSKLFVPLTRSKLDLSSLLSTTSSSLQDTTSDFAVLANSQNISIMIFYETRRTMIADTQAIIVGLDSAAIEGFPRIALDTNHRGLVQFNSPKDSNYLTVVQVLEGFVSKATGIVDARLGIPAPRVQSPDLSDQDKETLADLFIIDPSTVYQSLLSNLNAQELETGAWILSNVEFSTWLNSSSSQLIWLHGDAGSGKTRLVTYIIQELSRIVKLRNDAARSQSSHSYNQTLLAYFYCQFTDNRRNTAQAILRTLLYQLLQQRPDLMIKFRELYHRSRPDQDLQDIMVARAGVEVLWSILQELLENSTIQTLFIAVDALDECSTFRNEFINLLQPYIRGEDLSDVRNSPVTLSSKIKFLSSSRNIPDILDQLSGAREISMELNSNHGDDLRRFIAAKVEELSILYEWDEVFKKNVRDSIQEKSSGSFLWASLVLKYLGRDDRGKDANTVDRLLNTNKSLEEIYKQALTRLKSDQDALALLKTLVAVESSLTMDELSVVSGIPRSRSDSSDQLTLCVQRCSTFVSLIGNNSKVAFIHQTAFEFIKQSIREINEKALEEENAQVCNRCFEYILKLADWKMPSTLCQYPIAFWIQHAKHSSPPSIKSLLDQLPKYFNEHSPLWQSWFKAYWDIRHLDVLQPTRFTLMHLCAESGFDALAEKLIELDKSGSINEPDSLGNLPLHWASQMGHEDIFFKLLLSKTEDVEARNHDEMTPLALSALGGHVKIAEALIDKGARVNSKAIYATSVLQSAARNGHIEFVHMLLDKGADTEAQDMDGHTAAELAKSHGYLDISRLLLDYGQKSLATKPLQNSQRIDGGFLGAVADFLHPQSWRYFYKRVTVDRLLSGESFDDIMQVDKLETKIKNEIGDSRRSLRWLHLPANNMRWVEVLMAKHYKGKGQLQMMKSVLKPETWTQQQHMTSEPNVHGRFIRPTYCTIPLNESLPNVGDQKSDVAIMAAIPYLNWATEAERDKLNHIIHIVSEEYKSGTSPDETAIAAKTDRYEKLLWAYLYNDHPLHETRLGPGSKEVHQEDFSRNQSYASLDDTLITSFPQRWTEKQIDDFDPENKTDLLDSIFQELDRKAATIGNATDLWEFIRDKCVNLCFEASLYQSGELQFPECYEICIAVEADKESYLFKTFSEALAKEINVLTPDSHLKVDESMFQIKAETESLELIKDVRDELNMISLILNHQLQAFPVGKSLSKRQEQITALDQRAEKVYVALKDLLDLKQKQANVAEARFQRRQATEAIKQGIETAKQGKAILLFTIITIIFLPLSFMASFFALQIVDFPKLTLAFVLKFMLPISAAIFLPCILLALNIDLVSRTEEKFSTMMRSMIHMGASDRRKKPSLGDEEAGVDSISKTKAYTPIGQGGGMKTESTGTSFAAKQPRSRI